MSVYFTQIKIACGWKSGTAAEGYFDNSSRMDLVGGTDEKENDDRVLWRSQKRVSLTPQDQNHWIPSTGSSISSAGAFYCAVTTFPASQSISLTSF